MNRLNELVKDDFGIDLLKFMNEELQETAKHVESGSHDIQLSVLIEYYWLIRRSFPSGYRSKSGVAIRNYLRGFCEDLPFEYDDGIVENACLFLEKQFWEVIFSSFVGSYRSARTSLRHMLQLACWATQAIVNKETLSRIPEDCYKAMSVGEFETFLYENNELYYKKRSSDFIATNRDKPLEGISLWDLSSDFPLHLITYNNHGGRRAISRLYGDLSKFAHANHWKRVKLGLGKSEFLPNHNKEEFHKCLKLIIETHRVIFGLLILTAFHELAYYSKSAAYNFAKNVYDESEKCENKFSEIRFILEHLMKIFATKEIEEDLKRQEEIEDKMDDEENLCTECGEFMYGEDNCKECEQMKFMHGYREND